MREKDCLECQLKWFPATDIHTSNHPNDQSKLLCCTIRYEIYSQNQQSEMIGKFWGFLGNLTINTTLENSNVIVWSALDDEIVIWMKIGVLVNKKNTPQYDELWNILDFSTIWNNWKRWRLHCNSTIGTTLKNTNAMVRDKCRIKMFHQWIVPSSPRNQSGNECIGTISCHITRIDRRTCCKWTKP